MKLIFVGDRGADLQLFAAECEALPELTLAGWFPDASEALDFAREHHDIGFVLLDADCPGVDEALTEKFRAIRPNMVLMYLTARPEQAVSAVRQKLDYAIFKPVTKADVVDAFERASLFKMRQEKRIYATLFGSFDLRISGRPVRFRSAKARELMALLVCFRGRAVSIHEIVDCLWEGDANADVNSVGYRKAIKSLADTLTEYNAQRLLIRTRGYCRLRSDLLDCDYYEFLRGDRTQRKTFQGIFLPEYAWAENYIYPLLEMKQDMA